MSYNFDSEQYNYDVFSDSRNTNYSRRPQYNRKRKIRKRTRNRIMICTVGVCIILSVVLLLGGCFYGITRLTSNKKLADNDSSAVSAEAVKTEKLISKAKIFSAQYDYDTAISEVKEIGDYATNTELQSLVTQWESEKANLVEFPHEEITHVFFHSLIYEPELAFDPEKGNKADAYNLVMTTVDEFNKIISTMYNNGYVMVSMHDICTFDEKGNRVDHKIMLPKGKKAFVLSQDDLNYYHYQDGDGIATKLVFDENGKVKTEYLKQDGQTIVGDFDVVPIIDTFVEQHPDFAYKGHKGILALTGYNGVFGYRTDSVYKIYQNLDLDQEQFLKANPDFNYEQDVAEATKIAEAMKATGWEFATHTWGHNSVDTLSMESLATDTGKWRSYKGDNYFRMGRRNLDGYRMYHDADLLTDLFDAKTIIDPKRPTPVPTMEEVYGS